mmetsp:Transcript_76677/g.68736  ORF Transcript_76677/g.68736 Transcript_76677/m.68736 type:complete len:102 (+) Transcript_76677:2-307(+)
MVILGLVFSSVVPDHNVYWIFSINVLVQFLDVYTNFICIAFTFRNFIPWYNRVCGLCDNKCKQCCSSMFMSESLAGMHDQIEMSDSPGSSGSDEDNIEITI